MPLQTPSTRFKKRPCQALVTIALAILFLGSTAVCMAECIKTVRWSNDRPYAWQAEDGELRGIYIDLARELSQRLNCEPKFVQMPWARALAELEAGRLDLLFGAFPDTNRKRYAYFSMPINRSPNLLFMSTTAAKEYKAKELGDLVGTGFRLGAQIGVNYNGAFEKLQNNPVFIEQIVKISNRQSAWKMMAANRLDGLIADEMTALIELQELDLLHTIHRSRIEISGQAAAVALSKKCVPQEFFTQFDRHLQEMKSDGSYKSILERYLPCEVDIGRLGCR